MTPALAKLSRELWGAVQLAGFLIFAAVVFCVVPRHRDDWEGGE